MAISITKICNAALGKIGASRIVNYDNPTESSPQIVQCRTHYEIERDALIRSHNWRFASHRAVLSEDTESPAFEYDNQFILPSDFLKLKSIYDSNGTPVDTTLYSYAIEGDRLLTNDSTCYIRYIRRVTDVSKYDPLFVKALTLYLALAFVGPLAGGSAEIQEKVQREINIVMPHIKALDRQETNTTGQINTGSWLQSRLYHKIRRI